MPDQPLPPPQVHVHFDDMCSLANCRHSKSEMLHDMKAAIDAVAREVSMTGVHRFKDASKAHYS
jgi:hypothetical protein